MRFRVTLKARLVSGSSEPINDKAHEQVRDAFATLNVCGDYPGNGAIFVASSTGAIEMECHVEADGTLEAAQIAAGYIRTAMESAGIGVPHLPHSNHPSWTVEWVGVTAFNAVLVPV